MKMVVKWGSLGLSVLAAIFLFSNLNAAFISYAPDRISLSLGRLTIEEVANRLPGTEIVDPQNAILRVPYGKTTEYAAKAMEIRGVYRAVPLLLDRPQFSFKAYALMLQSRLTDFLHGDLGYIVTASGHGILPMKDVLTDMTLRTFRYFMPGLVLSVLLSVGLSMLAAMRKGAARVCDAIHALLIGLPDFVLIILLQLLAVAAYRMTGRRAILVVQLGGESPFLIPLLTVMLVPGVLIYGTLRLAIDREWGKDYVLTARSKGLTRWEVLRSHVFRNVAEDLLAVLPKATTLALASMAIAEGVCDILGLGGVIISPRMQGASALPVSCLVLVMISMLFHAFYALLRKRYVVGTREAA